MKDASNIVALRRYLNSAEKRYEDCLNRVSTYQARNKRLEAELAAEKEKRQGNPAASLVPNLRFEADQVEIGRLKGRLQAELVKEKATMWGTKAQMEEYQQLATELENEKRKNRSGDAGNIEGSYTQQRLEREKADLERQLKASKADTAKVQHQNNQFRRMITTTGAGDIRPTYMIINDYGTLIEQIQRIVVEFYPIDLTMKPRVPERPLPKQLDVLQLWSQRLTIVQLQNRLRCVLFHLLWEHVLNVPWFGLHNVPSGEYVEKVLAAFEQQRDGHDELVRLKTRTDWRVSTMKCASWIQSQYPPETGVAITTTAEMMDKFMEPFLPRTVARNTVKAAFLKLCQQAHALMLELSKDRVLSKVEIPVSGTLYDEKEHIGQDRDVRKRQAIKKEAVQEKPILFVLAGVLVDRTEAGERMVIAKAHVIL
ncbi:hypothetical protein DL98DRAFT_587934 [Cadophora sp. DSE1049]|nr:hypothetical protein DL98DRAFT_587934 [Cadophora sp. DSE1049]